MGDLLASLSLVPALLLTFVLPGLALSFAAFPRRLPGPDGTAARWGVAVLGSLLVAGAMGVVAAVAGALNLPVTAFALAAVTLGSVAIAWWRGFRPAMPSPARRRWPGLVTAATAALLAAVILAAVWAPEARIIQRDRMPTSGVTWYYWDTADQIARTHHLPDATLEWGRERPFVTTYLFFSATTAVYEQFTGADVRAQMEAFRFALLAVAILFGWLLYRRFLDRPIAAVALLFTFGGYFFLNRFSAYRPESFGITLALGGAWCLFAVTDGPSPPRERRAFAAMASLAFASAYLSHAIPLTALGFFAGGILVAGWALGRSRPRDDLRAVAAIALVAAVVGVATTFAVDQEFPLARAAAPRGEVDGVDLTWEIILATEGTGEFRPPPDFRGMLDIAAGEPWERIDLEGRPYLLLLFALPFAAWRWWTAGERRLAVGAAVFAALLAALVFGFYLVYDTYVPQRTGPDRIAPYGVLALAPLAALGIAGAARGLRRYAERRRASPARAPLLERAALLAVVLAVAAGVFAPTARGFVRRLDSQAITPESYTALRWLDDNLPREAVVLANAYTDGSISGIVHRLGLINGRVPFQAVPEFRDEAITLLQRARRFFRDPAGNTSLLSDYGVTHIIVARKTWVLGGSALYTANEQALQNQPGVRLLREFPRLNVYEVSGFERPPVVADRGRGDALPWLALAIAVSAGAFVALPRAIGWDAEAPGATPD